MEPLSITVCKADATILPVQPAVLSITGDLPRVAGTDESEWRPNTLALFRDEAQRIMRAFSSLPQGTLDQLLMQLLESRASLLRISVLADDGKEA